MACYQLLTPVKIVSHSLSRKEDACKIIFGAILKKRTVNFFLKSGLLLGLLYVVHEKWYMAEGPHLEIEGILKKPNFRDVGKSVNECLSRSGEKPLLKEKLLYRANKWFSGWSCEQVENPDEIYTLNYEPDKNFSYYCRRSDGSKNIGRIFSKQKEISDIEFLSSWSDETLKHVVCSTLTEVFDNFLQEKSSLFHCEAGRDRTGALASLFTAMALEHTELDPQTAAEAVECDYRKSKSISPDKYGRMANFLATIRESNAPGEPFTVGAWIAKTCKISPIHQLRASRSFLQL